MKNCGEQAFEEEGRDIDRVWFVAVAEVVVEKYIVESLSGQNGVKHDRLELREKNYFQTQCEDSLAQMEDHYHR